MNSQHKKLFCFGYGYSCDYLGYEFLQKEGWSVAGTTRDHDKREMLRERGVESYIFDHGYPLIDPGHVLDGVTHLVLSVPPGENGDPVFEAHAQDLLNIPTLEWVAYLSTTGVYGDREGAEVDEASELRPSSKRGSRRVRAEEQWLSLYHSHGFPLHIFRLAGIYGPGRSALDTIRVGNARRIDKPGHAFSRVHVEDIVRVLQASINQPHAGEVYNVCDDLAAPSHEVISYACELLGRPEPPLVPFEQADMSPMAQSFYSDNKRVRNDKMKSEFGLSLKYPDFRTGLMGCKEAEEYAIEVSRNSPFS